jgi:hypothetical protein
MQGELANDYRRSSLFADGVAGCTGSNFVVDRLWQLLCAVLPARRRIVVSIPSLNQVRATTLTRLFPCERVQTGIN